MHRRVMTVVTLSVLLAVPASALAQHNPHERRQDRREIRQDHREIRDDRLDHARLQVLLWDFDRARASVAHGRRAGLDNVDARLRHMLRQESIEGRREFRRDRRETHRSRREARADRRRGRPGETIEDRRDLRDDRRDRRHERASYARLQRIRQGLVPLYGRYDPASLARKRAYIVDLIAVARAELRQGRREIREDRRELREDRRR